jgi:hypothetical protein
MSDPKELASKARNTLSQALESLQSGDDVPESLIELAAPIAKSMGILHRIEKTGTGNAEDIDAALANVRGVLDALQEVLEQHPAVEPAMETVAGSLSKMFALSKALKAAAAPKPEPKAEPKHEAPAQEFKPTPKTVVMPPEVSEGRLTEGRPAPKTSEMHTPAPSAEPDAMREARRIEPGPRANPPAAEVPRAVERTAPPASERAPSKDKQRVAGTEGAALPPEGARVQAVELGAFSASNFYKGLSGNDVIEHGGIFVATYQIPKVGTPIAIRVHLPGDLEFDADAVVQWTRDVADESEPGYGARFTRVSHEARQLVYRYVRNREPMFYDDL